MTSREEFFASPVWGDDIDLVKDLIRHGESDSASLDHALELLILSGRSPEHAMCMLVPPAYRNDEDISDELRAFYQYIRSFSEPWDGPAGLVFTDGTKLCASLDRNGLRPSRYKITEDGILYIGSEAGAVVFDDADVVRKGRLGPGQMISANTATGEFKYDREIKEELAQQKPYAAGSTKTASSSGNSSRPTPTCRKSTSPRSIFPASKSPTGFRWRNSTWSSRR